MKKQFIFSFTLITPESCLLWSFVYPQIPVHNVLCEVIKSEYSEQCYLVHVNCNYTL